MNIDVRASGVLLFKTAPQLNFLLMKHADRWDLPKGHLDPGENEREAALRELFEETSIESDCVQLNSQFEFRLEYNVQYADSPDIEKRKRLTIFLARLTKPHSIVPTEHQGFQWFAWKPPHRIQEQTIDPLLAEVESFLRDHQLA